MSGGEAQGANALPRSFRWLLASKALSDLGSWMDYVALGAFAYRLTGSGFGTGLFLGVRVISASATGLTGGVLADRVPRKRLMLLADLARMIALLALALAPASLKLPFLFILAATLGVGGSLFEVAFRSGIPALVGEGQAPAANARIAAIGSVSMAGGFVLGGMVASLAGFDAVFLLDALTYAVSAGALFGLSLPGLERASAGAAPARTWKSFAADLGALRSELGRYPVLLTLLSIRLVDAVGSASHNIGMPMLAARMEPSRPTRWLGWIFFAWALGKLAASHPRARIRPEALEPGFLAATVGMSLGFIALFWSGPVAATLAAAAVAGFFDGASELSVVSRLQQAPAGIRGRIFGVLSTAQSSGFGLGMILLSPLADSLGAAWMVTLAHGVPMAASLYCLLRLAAVSSASSRAGSGIP